MLENVTDINRVKRNMDARIITSVVAGVFIAGGIIWAAKKVRPLRKVAAVAQGGK